MKLALKSISLAAVLVVLTASTPSVAGVTVGDFVRSTAHIVGVKTGTVEGMRAAGFKIPALNLQARLTEADVVSIGTAIGVPMQTATPTATVSERRAERMLLYLSAHAPAAPQGQESPSNSDPRQRPRSRSPRIPDNPFRNPL